MTFASAFAKPMKKFARVCFCSISQLNVLHFCLRSVFKFIFQGHMKVALLNSFSRAHVKTKVQLVHCKCNFFVELTPVLVLLFLLFPKQDEFLSKLYSLVPFSLLLDRGICPKTI